MCDQLEDKTVQLGRKDLVSIRHTLRTNGPEGLADAINYAIRCGESVDAAVLARARYHVRQDNKHGLADKMTEAIYEVAA